MQYHFLLMFDDKTKKWSVDWETCHGVMTDGTVYNPDMIERGFPNDIYPGWFWPEDHSPEQELDWTLYQALLSVVDTLPVPQEA